MDIRIVATCSGLEKIYPGIKENSFDDIRTASKSGGIGTRCYTISLKENSIEISKLIGIDDTHASRSGFLRIVLILGYNEINLGNEVFDTLNEINNLFKNHYLEYNQVNLEWFYRDIHLLEEIKSSLPSQYSTFNSSANKPIGNRTKNAHIYYKSFDDLIGYFDKPNQHEYHHFNTIYFVHEDERESSINPLYQFINYDEQSGNDLSKKVDLNNVEYQILSSDIFDCRIKVYQNNSEIEKYSGDFIRYKDPISIIFSKRYFNDWILPVTSIFEGNFNNLVEINSAARTIKIVRIPILESATYEFKISPHDRHGNPILSRLNLNLNLKKCQIPDESKLVSINENLKFNGADIELEWLFTIENNKKSNYYFYDRISKQITTTFTFKPANFKENVIRFYIVEVKIVKLNFFVDNKPADINQVILEKNGTIDEGMFIKNQSELRFINSQIAKNQRLVFRYIDKKQYEQIDIKEFYPNKIDDGVLQIHFKKNQNQSGRDWNKITKFMAILSVSSMLSVICFLAYRSVFDTDIKPENTPREIPFNNNVDTPLIAEVIKFTDSNKSNKNQEGNRNKDPQELVEEKKATKPNIFDNDKNKQSVNDTIITRKINKTAEEIHNENPDQVTSSFDKLEFNNIVKDMDLSENKEDLENLKAKVKKVNNDNLKSTMNSKIKQIEKDLKIFNELGRGQRGSYLVQ